jgi:tetratricopeptide (TPR) repeat protein
MKQFLLLPVFLICAAVSLAQQGTAEAIKNEGVALHDKGDYEGAIRKYDEAIAKDNTYYLAYYEKSLSLYAAGRYQDCSDCCVAILKKFPEGNENKKVYVNYGSALDGLDKPEEAIEVYKEGIKKYPDFYLLFYNKGLTEYSHKSYADAVADSKRSISLNPGHASSHLLLAYSIYDKNKIAALLALSTSLLIEPESKRAGNSLSVVLQILKSGVQKKDDKNISITLAPEALDTKRGGEDNFHSAELMIAMASALDYDEKHKDLPTALKIKDKFDMLLDAAGIDANKKAASLPGSIFLSLRQ